MKSLETTSCKLVRTHLLKTCFVQQVEEIKIKTEKQNQGFVFTIISAL